MDIRDVLKHYWGYDNFRPLQEDIIRSVLSGRDTLALMPTGGGKSITYQVPGLMGRGLCLVISPLIALMKDQVEDLNKRGIGAETIYTGMLPDDAESALNKAKAGKVKFLYISPERLTSAYFRERLKTMEVSLLAVDEAHCISQWGYDFRPSYLRIAEVREFFPSVPVLALTATATPRVAEDIQFRLKFAAPHVLSKSFRRENLSYVVRKATDRHQEACHILSRVSGSSIVYVRRRARAEELAKLFNEHGIRSEFYHAGLSSHQRSVRQDAWKSGDVPVMVATNAFGMGIDKPDVRLVLHFDIPESPEAYFQEAGRAGRDGKKAYAVLLYSRGTLARFKRKIQENFPERKYVQQVYRNLGDFFQIEEGTGGGYAFEFNPELFMETYHMEYVPFYSALNILQMAGYLECTTDIHARSRVSFLVLRGELYRIELGSLLLERLVEYLLRHYSGIFVQYAYVDEQLMADRLGADHEEIYQALLALARRKIISYIPGNDHPYILYHQARVPASYLHIGREAYEDRRESYAEKIARMAGYIEEEDTCRQLYLMRYFGQYEHRPCGMCDHCLAQKKDAGGYSREEVKQLIIDRLRTGERGVRNLIEDIDVPREQLFTCIRILLEEGKIAYLRFPLLTLADRQPGEQKEPTAS